MKGLNNLMPEGYTKPEPEPEKRFSHPHPKAMTRSFNIRMTPADHKRCDEAASKAGLSFAAWGRKILLSALNDQRK